MITFTIDTLTPCLTETSTGEIFETEVIRLKRKSFLTKFNKRTGWYVSWSKFEDDVEIYALVLKGTVDVQGLVAVKYDEFAIAAELSFEHGYEGYVFGDASNADVFRYYVDNFHALPINTTSCPLRFMVEGENTQKLMEVYNYEWTEEEL